MIPRPLGWPRREGGLRYLCAAGEFHLFLSTGVATGTFTQMGFEVEDIGVAVADLRSRGVVFEEFDLLPARVRIEGRWCAPGAP